MYLRQKITTAILAVSVVVLPNISNAGGSQGGGSGSSQTPNWQTFLAVGPNANTLETALDAYLLSKTVQDFGYSIYQQGRTFAGAGGTGSQESVTSTPQLGFVTKHQKAYCSANLPVEVQGFGCKGPSGQNDTAAAYLELGDINYAAVVDNTQYTQLNDIIAQNLIRNIVSPFPDPTYKGYLTSIQNGSWDNGTQKTDYANFMAGQAVLGVALNSFNKIYGDRLPGSSYKVSGAASSTSLMALMQSQCTQRFEQPAWATYLGASSTTQLMVLQEIAAMQAFSLWMEYQKYQQMERIESLLAAALAKMVNDSYSTNKLISSASAVPTSTSQ